MKLLALILLVSLTPIFNHTDPKDPDEFSNGTSRQEVLQYFPEYHFMFYKNMKEVFVESEKEITFSMLGYWEGDRGYVLCFLCDKLIHTANFDNPKEYNDYITSPTESQNIQIIEENYHK